MTKLMNQIKQFAKKYLDEIRWLHTQEVVKIALTLAKKEKADQEIVAMAAWLHDVGATHKKAKLITHHVFSAKMAQKFLEELNLESKKIEKVIQCIKEHMGPKPGFFGEMLKAEGKNWSFLPRPSNKESKVIYDADMINLGGPFGVTKTIILAIKQGKSFKKAITEAESLSKQAFGDLKTKSGKKLGKKYFSVSENFLKMIKPS